jgi:PAS domain S-box-containing protein
MPEDLAAGKPTWELEVAAREGRFADEGWRLRKDGTPFWANVVITALRTPDGELVGFTKVTRDLTQRRADDEALRESEERFRLLVQAVRDYAIFMLDPDGRVASWNAGAERIKGYRAEEIIGQHFSVFYPEVVAAAKFPEHELEVASRTGSFEDEGWRVRKDGTQFWANVVITALRDPTGRLIGFAKVTRDLTERRRAQEQAIVDERRAAAAEASNLAKSQFLATMSHELRTPLNAIGGYVELLEMGLRGPVTEQQREDLARIRRSQQHLLGLINDVLNFAKLDAGSVRFDLTDVPLADAVAAAESMVAPQIAAKNLRFVLPSCENVPAVRADAEKLRQVLLNLLGNAVKFTDRGGEIAVTCEAGPTAVRLAVRDTGIGIPAEKLEAIFEPFVQVDRHLSRPNEGVGLGLAISRELARGMGGELTAESVEGTGSTFTLTLPRAGER